MKQTSIKWKGNNWPIAAVCAIAVALLLAAPLGAGFSLRASKAPVGQAVPAGRIGTVADRAAMASTLLGPGISPLLNQEQMNLNAARDLLNLAAPGHTMDLHAAAALAERGTRWQAATLGLPWSDAVVPHHKLPSQALLELASRYHALPSAEQAAGLASLDALAEPVRSALTGLADAFLVFDESSREAYGHANLALLTEKETALQAQESGSLEAGIASSAPMPGDLLRQTGVDLSAVLPARVALLEASVVLRDALAQRPLDAPSYSPTVAMPPIFSIDLDASDDTYTAADPFVLLVDAGGNDTYLNNAGGNNLGIPNCTSLTSGILNVPAAALMDFGSGNDKYGSASSPRACGANGGGYLGAGFLLDDGGNDSYRGFNSGANGGGFAGLGFLLDGGGNDSYTAGADGVNGGGILGGVGFLLDSGGNDAYAATEDGTNGGGNAGVGFLFDESGNDTYSALDGGTNGGGDAAGVGFLLDHGGNDIYLAGNSGTNGGGNLGVGFLFEAGGNDDYTAGKCGVNGGGSNCAISTAPPQGPGVGLLLDVGGIDRYQDTDTGICQNPATNPASCTVIPKGTVGAQVDGDCRLVFSDVVCTTLGL